MDDAAPKHHHHPIRTMLTDENGKFSMSRFVLLAATVILGIIGITDAYADVTVNEGVYTILQSIFIFGLGGSAARTTVKNWKE